MPRRGRAALSTLRKQQSVSLSVPPEGANCSFPLPDWTDPAGELFRGRECAPQAFAGLGRAGEGAPLKQDQRPEAGVRPDTLNIAVSRPSTLLPMASSMRSTVGGIKVQVLKSRNARSAG